MVGYCERGGRLFSWAVGLVDLLGDFYGFDGIVHTDSRLCPLSARVRSEMGDSHTESRFRNA